MDSIIDPTMPAPESLGGSDPVEQTQDMAEGETPDAMGMPDYDQEVNLAEKLPEWFLKAVATRVVADKDADWKSSEGYRARKERHYKMFAGELPGKPEGQENIVLVHLPYTTKAVLMFHSKMNKAFFPATGDICGMTTIKPSLLGRARRVSRDMNQRLRRRVPEYIPAHDRNGIKFLLYGSTFTVFYYDTIEKRPKFESCSSDNIIVPYKFQSDYVDMRDVPRITWKKELYRHELEDTERDGYYINVKKKLFPEPYGKDGAPELSNTSDIKPDQGNIRETADRMMGVSKPMDDGDAPREILEQDRWLLLPGEERQRPVTVCVDQATNTVLRLALREREEPRDRQRHANETKVRDAQIQSQQAMHAQAMAEHAAATSQYVMAQSQGMIPPEFMPPAPPIPPEEPPMPAPIKKIAFNRFTHYGCIPNPEGFYFYGLGYLLEGHNILADEVMSRYVSLLTMHLLPTYFYSRHAKGKRGDIKLVLGQGNETDMTIDQVNNGAGMFQFQFPAPDQNAFKIEERQSRAAQEITADDVAMGAGGLSGQTATETEYRSAAAMDNISTVAGRYNRARGNEIQVLAYILSQTLEPEGETFYEQKQGADGQVEHEEFTVTPEDYNDEFDVNFTSDPNLATQPARQAKAMKIMQTVATIPPGTLDPVSTVSLLRAALSRVLLDMEASDMAAIVANAQPPQLPPQPGQPPQGQPNGRQQLGAMAPEPTDTGVPPQAPEVPGGPQ